MDGSVEYSPEDGNGLQGQDRFLGILQAFGQSFLQPDISVFKQNLAALEDINAKWKLYHKVFVATLPSRSYQIPFI